MENRAQAEQLMEVLANKKAQDIVAIHVGDKTVIADWFVIASGYTEQQVKALADEAEDQAQALGLKLLREEGYAAGRWTVLDFGNILLHLFHPDERRYYNMERLWDDEQGNLIRYEDCKKA